MGRNRTCCSEPGCANPRAGRRRICQPHHNDRRRLRFHDGRLPGDGPPRSIFEVRGVDADGRAATPIFGAGTVREHVARYAERLLRWTGVAAVEVYESPDLDPEHVSPRRELVERKAA